MSGVRIPSLTPWGLHVSLGTLFTFEALGPPRGCRGLGPGQAFPRLGCGRIAIALWTGRRSEDAAGPDAPPDDVRLAGHAFGSVAEGGAAIVVPGHREHVRVDFHAFDAQTRPERPVRGRQVRHEGVLDHLAEDAPLLGREVL